MRENTGVDVAESYRRVLVAEHAQKTVQVPLSKRQARRLLGSVIYALRLDDGVIKIGWTRELDARVRSVTSYNHSSTSELLAFRPGEYDEEQELHAQLKPHRAHGREYYRPTPEVLAVVNQMREALGLSEIRGRQAG